MEAKIDVQHLTKRFGPVTAVDDVSFSVGRGEVLGFLGPNGAGKSTTMKMITGFLAPTRGTAAICGLDIIARPIEAKRHIGYLPEGAPAYPDMTAAGFLAFVARIRGFDGAEAKKRVDLAVERTTLKGVLDQPIETLSKGFKRRVGLAQALLHDPEVLILDEPTDGLDPNQKHEVRNLIGVLAPEKAIVISTHILEEVDAVCTRAIVIAGGKVLIDDTPGKFAARSRHHNSVRLMLADPAIDARTALLRLPGVASVETVEDGEGKALLVVPQEGRSIIAEVTDLVRTAGWPVAALRVERGKLDDVFRDITKKAA
ncbi:MAG TPA: ATP-binding cassette domain-containing protein [Stellaceae bacterium]|nr:ATP-binding cassette domain-containing protein [Stellaceae bacterium]